LERNRPGAPPPPGRRTEIGEIKEKEMSAAARSACRTYAGSGKYHEMRKRRSFFMVKRERDQR